MRESPDAKEMQPLTSGSIYWPTKIMNDCGRSTSRNAGKNRREANDGNCHEELPTLGGQVNQRGTEFSPALFADRNIQFGVLIAHVATVTHSHPSF